MKKRVYTLYRVSTIGQVEKDDIPMQKEACHEFAERQGWEIVKEFSEKGVSGFKKSAKERDQLQLLQQAAAAGEFDVLCSCLTVWVGVTTKRPLSWNGSRSKGSRSGA